MITDLGYDRLRQVDAKWVENYLSEAFEESDILRPIYAGGYQFDSTPPSGGDNDDLGDIDEFENPPADKGSASQRMVGVLLESLLRTDPDGDVKLSNSEGKKSIRRPVLHAAVNEAMRAAAEEAKQVARAGNALQVPANSLSAAAKNVSRATTSYQEVRGRTGLDEAAVEETEETVGTTPSITIDLLTPKAETCTNFFLYIFILSTNFLTKL